MNETSDRTGTKCWCGEPVLAHPRSNDELKDRTTTKCTLTQDDLRKLGK